MSRENNNKKSCTFLHKCNCIETVIDKLQQFRFAICRRFVYCAMPAFALATVFGAEKKKLLTFFFKSQGCCKQVQIS